MTPHPGLTPASWALLGAAAALAAADWVAVATRRRRVEYVCKPAVVILLAACALTLDPVDGLRRAYVVTALTLSLAGDVFLMLPEPPPPEPRTGRPQGVDWFPFGLAAFLLAQLNYVAGFRAGGPGLDRVGLALLLVLPVAVPLGTVVVRSVAARQLTVLQVPVIAYIAVLGAMVASAVATGNLMASAGAWFFLASDAALAWDRFVRSFRWAPVIVAVAYHLAQGLLTVSLVR